jgi:uncharacterized repeat protein (TIGR03803 family)
MSRDRTLGGMSAALLALIIVILEVVPGASAQHNYESLYAFTGGADGDDPSLGGVIFDDAGNLYGTTRLGGTYGAGTVFKLTPNSDGRWTESVLHNFTGGADGGQPIAGLVFDGAGSLYGTTYGGSAYGFGTVFKLTPNANGSWKEKVLHNFTGGADGGQPIAGLVFDGTGNLYGTTAVGGVARYGRGCDLNGCGVVFELTPHPDGSWKEKVLHNCCFLTNCNDGFDPSAALIFDQAGNLYGNMESGGNFSQCDGFGCGVIFQLTTNADGSWREKVLHHFSGGADGYNPSAGVVFDAAGNLYGTTASGGNFSQCDGFGCGLVFQLTPNADGSWTKKVLHHFTGGADGFLPTGLVFDGAGSLYGTTAYGGNLSDCNAGLGGPGCGVVFKLLPNSKGSGWHERVLHYFVDHPGAFPDATLIFDAAGNLYGTTEGDGATTFGSVFKIVP